ncbi:class I SAM-dependent methyltransferase [Flavivirga spongiicola]|uniref:Methyltransferase domain-containing protein n=1 Tax=Flavivirga spongiicola TaxID=421621 RepID=A0ABU7XUT3_9FLAO|nr:class I SAM-dependent methyltransferase [Flavivirga sp. MEBiC05379]MDO5979337.1 methyltransferase domain-containing protein [Flavivirga sp. MEBiC05379]
MDFEKIAKQLAHPSGAFGIEVALGMNKMNKFISKTTYELLQVSNADRVLEIGPGNGKFIKDILNSGNNIYYTGIDISETMIAEAKKINDNLIKAGYVDLILTDVEKMPFLEEAFNKICTANTIYFWQNPSAVLKEVYRTLTKDGLFVISFRPYIKGQSLDFSEYGFTEYKSEDVEAIIHQTEFKIIEKREQIESPIEFNGQIHNLTSQYYLLQKNYC